MEWFVTIFIFIGVIAVTAVLFGGWVIFSIVRLVIRMIGSLVNPGPPALPGRERRVPRQMGHGMKCANERCKQVNPYTAHFCRRCGGTLPSGQHVSNRRAAMW